MTTSTQTKQLVSARKANRRVCDYLIQERGLSEQVLDTYDIGFVSNPLSKLNNRIVCPIKNLYGDVLGYQGRALPWLDLKPKYSLSAGVDKSYTLYGLYESAIDESIFDFVCLTEGNFNVLAMKQLGLPAVSPMGVGLSKYQIFLLGCFTKKIILIPDNDAPGIKNMEKVKEILKKWEFSTRLIRLPEAANDFNDLLLGDPDLLVKTVNYIKHEANYI